MNEIPWTIVVPLVAVVVVVDGALLWDLRRSRVQHLPKWAWALIILLVSFPVGPIVYLALGRVSKHATPVGEAPPPTPVSTGTVGGGAPPAVPLPPPDAAQRATAPHIDLAVRPTADRPSTAPPAAAGPAVISTRSLRKEYGDLAAVDDVDLVVPEGSTYGLIGPNGAGKTTLLSMLAGLRYPTAGEIDLAVERRRIAVLPDTPHFEPWLTAREVVDLARHLVAPEVPASRVDEALEEAGVAHAADRRSGGFSRGMLQRLGIATCLVGEPDVFVMDEPSSALDPAGRRDVLDLISRLGRDRTVLLSTHILGDVQQVCDTVGVIDQGRLKFQGPIRDLLTRTSTVYRVQVRDRDGRLRDTLEATDWVESVHERSPGELILHVTDADAAERLTPGLVAGLDVGLVSFGAATDLETAFLELVR